MDGLLQILDLTNISLSVLHLRKEMRGTTGKTFLCSSLHNRIL